MTAGGDRSAGVFVNRNAQERVASQEITERAVEKKKGGWGGFFLKKKRTLIGREKLNEQTKGEKSSTEGRKSERGGKTPQEASN